MTGDETRAGKTLPMCLTHCFFNSVLLDYFLKHSGDRDSKEQLLLAKAGIFSHTAVFSMAHPVNCTLSLKSQEGTSTSKRGRVQQISPPRALAV